MNVLAGMCLAVGCSALFIALWSWRLDNRSWLNRLVALSLVVYALRCYWTAVALLAPDFESFAFAQRTAVLAALVLQPLGVAVVAAAVQLNRPWAWLAVLGSAALVLVVVGLSGGSLVEGVRPGPWGNAGVPSSDPSRFLLVYRSTNAATMLSIGLLWWKWKTTRSRRYRSAILMFVVIGGFANVLSYFCYFVAWREWGFPDITVLARVPILVLSWVLISRYRFLKNGSPEVDDALFRSLEEPLGLLDASGRVREVSTSFARLLGRSQASLRHRPLGEVLGGWEFERHWAEVERHRPSPQQGLGTIDGQTYSLVLEPLVDRFGDLTGALVRLGKNEDLTQRLKDFGLSDREVEVGTQLVSGRSGPEIAVALGISPATVKNHLHSLFQKTATANRVDLVRTLLRATHEERP